MIKSNDLHWLAGFLEGEGSFICHRNYPKVHFTTVNKFNAKKVSKIFGFHMTGPYGPYKSNPLGKLPHYDVHVSGKTAAAYMMMLYYFMSPERQLQISNALIMWKKVL